MMKWCVYPYCLGIEGKLCNRDLEMDSMSVQLSSLRCHIAYFTQNEITTTKQKSQI